MRAARAAGARPRCSARLSCRRLPGDRAEKCAASRHRRADESSTSVQPGGEHPRHRPPAAPFADQPNSPRQSCPKEGIVMDIAMLIKAFVVGGIICAIGQVLIDYTKLTPARILVSFVVIGVILGGPRALPAADRLCRRGRNRSPDRLRCDAGQRRAGGGSHRRLFRRADRRIDRQRRRHHRGYCRRAAGRFAQQVGRKIILCEGRCPSVPRGIYAGR